MKNADVNAINPYIRVAMRSLLRKGTLINRRIIFDYELIFIERGSMIFFYDSEYYRCESGSFLLIRPGISHSFNCAEEDLSQPHIHFDITYSQRSRKTPVSFKDIQSLSHDELELIEEDIFSDFKKTPFVTFPAADDALELFFRVIDSFSAKRSLAAKGALTELLSMLIENNFQGLLKESDNDYSVAEALKDYIDSTNGIAITLDSLEKQFSYTRFHLEREFKKKYGTSLISYSNKRRIERAKALLGRKTVSEVAEELGFSSIYAFSRAFRGICKKSPTDFKKSKADDSILEKIK